MDQGLLGFATLLIGLATGPRPVELLVARPVAAVTVILDGREVAALAAPPWRAVVDLGEGPRPHRLEAVGLDRGGAEIARAVQWVNLPRPSVDLDLVLERGEDGTVLAARLAWASARPEGMPTVRAVLDGQALPAGGAERLPLPAVDASRPHFLRVDADFGGDLSASRSIAFGGAYSDSGAAGLTAIPTTVARGRTKVSAADVTASSAAGEPLQVVAVEEGTARVVAVVDRRADWLRSIVRPPSRHPATELGDTPCRYRLLHPPQAGLGDDEIVVVPPCPSHFLRDGVDMRLFSALQTSRTSTLDLVSVLLRRSLEAVEPEPQTLTNAVATAGVIAAAGGHRRAVVVVLSAADAGGGDITVAHAREFLRLLGVPLYVWSPGRLGASDWGTAENISSCARLERASRDLARDLERQRIVWVEGLRLPQEVVLSSARLARLE
jgi:hypothetical protein